MQETMCYIGQLLVFEEAEQVVNTLSGSNINAKQIERVCHFYGNSLEEKNLHDIEVMNYEVVSPKAKEELHYVSIDGSMLLTREEKWKEIKLGRIYKHNDIVNINKERNQLIDSQYIVHLGNHIDFIKKMEIKISDIRNKVFICDGAKWIWNYVDLYYPESVQILDYFHAKEHLCDFAKKTFKDDLEKAGLIFSGLSPDEKLPEIIEIKDHPFFIAVQFHPELKSRPFAPHPIFVSFIKAAIK